MDSKNNNWTGLTATTSSPDEQKICDTRDLPPTKGTTVLITSPNTVKEFREIHAVCLFMDIIGLAPRLVETHQLSGGLC